MACYLLLDPSGPSVIVGILSPLRSTNGAVGFGPLSNTYTPWTLQIYLRKNNHENLLTHCTSNTSNFWLNSASHYLIDKQTVLIPWEKISRFFVTFINVRPFALEHITRTILFPSWAPCFSPKVVVAVRLTDWWVGLWLFIMIYRTSIIGYFENGQKILNLCAQ